MLARAPFSRGCSTQGWRRNLQLWGILCLHCRKTILCSRLLIHHSKGQILTSVSSNHHSQVGGTSRGLQLPNPPLPSQPMPSPNHLLQELATWWSSAPPPLLEVGGGRTCVGQLKEEWPQETLPLPGSELILHHPGRSPSPACAPPALPVLPQPCLHSPSPTGRSHVGHALPNSAAF